MLNTVEVTWLQVHLPHLFLWEVAIDQVLTVSIWIICVKCMIMYVISTERYIFWVTLILTGFHQAAHSRKSFKL